MADFHQNGIVTTLHNLIDRPLADIETDLLRFSQVRPLGLLLPSLFSELEGEALPDIIDQINSGIDVKVIYSYNKGCHFLNKNAFFRLVKLFLLTIVVCLPTIVAAEATIPLFTK